MRDALVITSVDALSPALRAEAERALVGDRTCSLENMERTCFASEYCAFADGDASRASFCSGTSFHANALLALVALTVRAGTPTFVGCVCVGPAAHFASAFPYARAPQDGWIVYNLCVASAFQGSGVGRRLLDAVRVQAGSAHPLYLTVMRTRGSGAVERTMRDRVARLEGTYARLGCERCYTSAEYILYRANV